MKFDARDNCVFPLAINSTWLNNSDQKSAYEKQIDTTTATATNETETEKWETAAAKKQPSINVFGTIWTSQPLLEYYRF